VAATIDDLREGKIPLDTATQIHLLAHRHYMDRYADDRVARRIGEAAADEILAKAQELLKKM